MLQIRDQRIERVPSTEDALYLWLEHAEKFGSDAKGLVFRLRFRDVIRTKAICQRVFGEKAKWSLSEATWTFDNGATLKMRHLARWEDTLEFRGQTFTFMLFDQGNEWLKIDPIRSMTGSLRSSKGVPCRFVTTGELGA